MSKLQAPRGCPDIFPKEVIRRNFILKTARLLASKYGFKEHETPIFEHSSVFEKNLGEGTDVVSKEMYSFIDKGGESLTLRPEATASVARLFISHKLYREVPYKVFYHGPMFRHERPQRGRQRQFTQIGVENIGLKNPKIDAETIALGYQLVQTLVPEQQWQVEINNIGNSEDREKYKKVLVEFLNDHKKDLSEDSQNRLYTNPLRILDSKSESDQNLLDSAPEVCTFINGSSKTEFDQVKILLEALKIPFKLNPRLVRGLDYYNDTVFEITSSTLGAQNAVLAGGRYDNLIEGMGGQKCPSFGWAAGLERLSLLFGEMPETKNFKIGVIDINHSEDVYLSEVCHILRSQSSSAQQKNAEIYWSETGNFSKQMKKSESYGCDYVIIFGPDEIKSQNLQIKNLQTGHQLSLAKKDLQNFNF